MSKPIVRPIYQLDNIVFLRMSEIYGLLNVPKNLAFEMYYILQRIVLFYLRQSLGIHFSPGVLALDKLTLITLKGIFSC